MSNEKVDIRKYKIIDIFSSIFIKMAKFGETQLMPQFNQFCNLLKEQINKLNQLKEAINNDSNSINIILHQINILTGNI